MSIRTTNDKSQKARNERDNKSHARCLTKYIKIIIKITLETASIYGKNNLVTMSKYILNLHQRPSLKAKNTYRQESDHEKPMRHSCSCCNQ